MRHAPEYAQKEKISRRPVYPSWRKVKKLAAVAVAAGGEKKLYLRIAIKSVFDVKKLSVPIAGNGEFLRQNRCACRPSKGIAETLLGLDGFVYGAL